MVRARVVVATIFITTNNQPLRPITIDDSGEFFAVRRGFIGFAVVITWRQQVARLALGFGTVQHSSGGSAQDRWMSVLRAWQGIDPKHVYSGVISHAGSAARLARARLARGIFL